MHFEHEEAMRADYTEHTELGRQMFDEGVTDADIDRIDTARQTIEHRWHTGPHSEHWAYLSEAHADWRRSPRTMQRLLADAQHNGDGSGLTDIERRSQEQARALTGHDRPTRSQVTRER